MVWRSGQVAVIQLVLLLFTLWLGVAIAGQAGGSVAGAGARSAVSVIPRHKVRFPRAKEVAQNCPLLTPGDAKSNPAPSRRALMRRLSFRNGDWDYDDSGAARVLPFLRLNDSALPATSQLASFWVTDMTQDRKLVREFSGLLELSIIDGQQPFRYPRLRHGPGFQMIPGTSILSIEVEGLHQQAENEDVVCMLGCTYLPSPDNGLHFSNIQNSTQNKNLDKTCNIKVELSYPLRFNLTSRVVRGTVHSLSTKNDPYYFPPISVSSQIGSVDAYEPANEDFSGLKAACPSSPAGTGGSTALRPFEIFRAQPEDFCYMASDKIYSGSVLNIEPTWKCNTTKLSASYCRQIGPFETFPKHSAYYVDYNSSRAELLVQSFHYKCYGTSSDSPAVPLSFVLRLVPADEDIGMARRRTALDGQTIVAEGYWKNGTLCMVGCKLNDETGQADDCNSKITLSIPAVLSITQRDAFKGSITSLLPSSDPKSFFPLTFHVKLDYDRPLALQLSSALRYNYSMLNQAAAVLYRYEPLTNRKVKWFKYPSLAGENESHYQGLATDLRFHDGLKSKSQQQGAQVQYTYLDFDVVAIDQYLPFVWTGFTEAVDNEGAEPTAQPVSRNETIVTETNPKWTHRQREARKFLNISATMVFNTAQRESLRIYAEGLYIPENGKLYMVGCRTVHASWQQMFGDNYNLVDGMDCEIEVIMEYPTTLRAWLLNPGVNVKVHSRRTADDAFHLPDFEVETDPILYKQQRQAILSRKSVEGALSIVTLSLMLACIISQLLYTGSHVDSAPYVSLVMLGVQAMGYAMPLITGAESLLVRKFDYRKDPFFQQTASVQVIVYVDKLMTLVALLLLLRIFDKVRKERAAHLDKGPQETMVLVICLIIHAVGFASVMVIHMWNPAASLSPIVMDTRDTRLYNGTQTTSTPSLWAQRLALTKQVSMEYVGLLDDLFLLPQAIALSLWEISGRPLRFSFFVGLTLLQIVPHVYDHLRNPRFEGVFFPSLYANPNFDFYSTFGNFLIPALALLLAVVVYCQQRWHGILRFKPKFRYRRLGGKTGETELVSNGRSHLPSIPEE